MFIYSLDLWLSFVHQFAENAAIKRVLTLSITEYVWGGGGWKDKRESKLNINFPKYRKYKVQSGFIKK